MYFTLQAQVFLSTLLDNKNFFRFGNYLENKNLTLINLLRVKLNGSFIFS